MNRNGFMFSIEMLAVVSVVIVAVAAIASFASEDINNTTIFEIKNMNKATIAIYNSSDESGIDTQSEIILCKTIADYDYELDRLVGKTQCGWN